MRLKTLELQGFKSFPDKTVISFDRGITVVVGPNGSGKSNISDAMRWVLGEISSKNIRGGKMEDVVFAGSQQRSPMGYAEVSVTFDNTEEEGKVAALAEYDEITVTRRYYRVGDSEYFINRKAVRLRDIHELFLNTGLGRDGYSIIGQGRIAEIISQKNDERRAIFEEAAGIARYRYQKTDATKKLEDTESNLVRIEDIAGVLGERVEPLERESEKAKKYLELRDAKMAVDIALSLFDVDTAKATADELSGKLVLAKAEFTEANEAREDLERAEENARNEEMTVKLETERVGVKILELTSLVHESEANIRLAEKDAVHLKETLLSSEEKIRAAEEMLSSAESEEKRLSLEYDNVKKRVDALTARESDAERAVSDAEKTLADHECAISVLETDIAELRHRQTQAVVDVSVAAAREESDAQKFAELEKNIEKYTADISLFDKRIETAKTKISGYRKREEALTQELDTAANQKKDHENTIKVLTDRKNNLFLEVSQRKHKIQNLVRMEEFLEGYAGAVRFIVSEHKNGKIVLEDGSPAKIYGPVSRLISVPDEYSAALEIAFGQSLQNIVVEDEESAKAAIAYLKKKNAGRATFYPVSTMRGNELSENDVPAAHRAGFVAVASALVECDEKYRGIVRSLLGRILIAKDINSANKIARAMNFRYRIVTLDGQVINAGGSFTGGSLSSDGRILSRRVQIEKLGEEVKTLEDSLSRIKTEIESQTTALDGAKKRENGVLASMSGLKTLYDAEHTQLTVLTSNRDAQQQTLDGLRGEYDRLTEEIRLVRDRARELEGAKLSFTERIREAENRAGLMTAQKADLTAALRAAQSAHAAATLEKAKSQASLDMLEQMLHNAKLHTEEIAASLESLRATVKDAEEKIRLAGEEIVNAGERIKTLQTELAQMEQRKTENAQKSLALEKKLTEFRFRSREIGDRRDLLYRTYTKIEAEYQSVRERRDKLIAFLWDEYELTYTEAVKRAVMKVTAENRTEAVSAQNKYKNQLRALGSVNVNAIEEYKEVKKQYDDLTAQIDDLKKSKESLLSIIADLELTMQRDFMTTIEAININFGRVFTELFGGGRAEIRLSDPTNVLESGIEINVAPPGKVIKNMSLLSGGEQAFVAIALYFAILNVNPSPFCILDEIEAALDEVNVDKFAEYVKKYSDKTQFVIITHRRGTMEAAERLYGVTMHEKGISDVISIDVSEIEKKIGVDLR
jgi:chromosome segregation protein